MEDNICAICSDVHDDTTIALPCKHRYHYECLKYSFSMCDKECPYCRKKTYVNLKKLYEKAKNKQIGPAIVPIDLFRCAAYNKSGKRKGQQCSNRYYLNNEGFCRVHRKLST